MLDSKVNIKVNIKFNSKVKSKINVKGLENIKVRNSLFKYSRSLTQYLSKSEKETRRKNTKEIKKIILKWKLGK